MAWEFGRVGFDHKGSLWSGVVLGAVAVLLACGQARAAEEPPGCDFGNVVLHVPADMPGRTLDPDHRVDDEFEYGVKGCVFTPLESGEIPLREDANRFKDDSVFKVLAKFRRGVRPGEYSANQTAIRP